MASFIFIRHGHTTLSGKTDLLNRPGLDEQRDAALLESEREPAARLRAVLIRRHLEPRYVLCSSWRHARDTARLVAGEVAAIAEAVALTPHTPDSAFSLESLRDSGAEAGIDWASVPCVALVGHETRLSQLAEMMTGVTVPRLARLSAGIVTGESCAAMLARSAETTREIVTPRGDSETPTS